MTRGEIRAYALDILDDPSGTYFTPTIMNQRINFAQKEVQKNLLSANKQNYTKYVYTNLVIGQAAYALPSDFIQVVRLEMVTSGSGDTAATVGISPKTPNQKDDYQAYSGDPLFYTFDKANIILEPVPLSIRVLRMVYSYRVVDMTNDNDVPDVPDQFVEYLPILVARDCFIKDGRPTAPIQEKLDSYKLLLKQIAEQRNIDRPRMVTTTFNEW